MESEAMKQLIEKAKKNPKFFHTLVFDPEKALDELGLVDRKSKAALFAIDPEQFLTQLLSPAPLDCAPTCSDSCGFTCGQGSCGVTCGTASTCNFTCGKRSCKATAMVAPQEGAS